jgi:hypothetical protein
MKMFNRKPCMKCGGKVKYKKGGTSHLAILAGGGTPPNCDIGYMIDPNDPTKCIPITQIKSTPDLSLFKKSDPFTVSGDKDNPFGINKSGLFSTDSGNCPDGYKFDSLKNKCVPDPNTSFQLPTYKIENGNLVSTGTSTLPTSLKFNDCPEGQTKNIITGECETKNEEQKCEPGYIFDPKQNKCVKDISILPNTYLEGINSAVNWAAKMFAPEGQRRAQEDYLRQQIGLLGQRQPIPDWATNEQKQPIGYNLYTKYGGSINNKNNNMIKIKKENKGKFTAQAKRAGMGVQEFANYVLGNPDKFSAATMKRANFAKNAAGWKKEFGGMTEGNPYYSSLMETNPLFMQEGGAMPMQGQEGGGEDQMQQIIQMIIEALQEGMAPEEIIQALVQMGIPEEQAVQLLQAVIEQIQGQGGGMGQGQPMQGGQQQAAPMMAYGGKSMPNNAGFRALPTDVQRMIMNNMQEGGMMRNNQKEQISTIIQAYASATNQDPNDVMKQLLSMKSDDEKTAFLIEMQSTLAQLNKSGQTQQQGMMRMGGLKYYR